MEIHVVWAAFFMSGLICSSSQYIHLNEKDDCINLEKISENYEIIQTLLIKQIRLQNEVEQLRQDNREMKDLLLFDCIVPFDCYEIYNCGRRKTGVYRIFPYIHVKNFTSVHVICDMELDGGGWTVIQHRNRENPHVNFNATWGEYKRGFGDVRGNYWIGNDVINKVTTAFQNDLYIRIKSTNNQSLDVKYNLFSMSSEASGYMLSLGTTDGYDAFRHFTNKIHHPFSTYDHDKEHRCGARCGSGWWYDFCTWTNLNAPFFASHIDFVWYPTIKKASDLYKSEMMIRRK